MDVDANAVYAAGDHEPKLPGSTALHILACGVAFWHVEALEYLLSKRPNIEARNKMGLTPLLAAIHGDMPYGPWREETVRVLLRHGADVNAIMETTEDVWGGSSALEMSNHAGITKLLLENGASVKSCPGILTRVIREWMDPEIAKLLLDAGLDPDELPSLQEQTRVDFALQGIVRGPRPGIPRFYDRGIPSELQPREAITGRTLLASACIPMIPMAHVLLNVGADPLIVDDEGRTPLHWLCTFQGPFDVPHRNAFTALTRNGPGALTIRDKQGRTPLHLALATHANVSQHSLFAVQHLLAAGADPAEPDPTTGNSALHSIAPRLLGKSEASAAAATLFRELATRVEALDVFVELGADLQAVDGRRRTLLHAVAEGWDLPGWDVTGLFKRLMELGVDPRAEDEALRTAIDVAVARELRGVVMLFTEEGKMEEAERQVRADNESNSDKSSSDSDSEDEDDLGILWT
ncbi:hypothetical protein CHGG_01222 [Chaetomium globosum CBS 148.51]|uniref:Uncharacterized protein n=1 Tax=Chaetomium globosum (strain ATCC 6205 / CBS 148.51 / DSM 1962 / NBRC 6347 / NRRL 1970) TaxID=306901 RepID=Q2HEY2_CHAGB|nr:uncharacterized protein CHGG_01222 [Chaetomium globosum CBS 148.51]EAQ92987.1 hypothetical protein CHGG_01222 [Chaetomium globosum CBS 148.51]